MLMRQRICKHSPSGDGPAAPGRSGWSGGTRLPACCTKRIAGCSVAWEGRRTWSRKDEAERQVAVGISEGLAAKLEQ